jgi:hypothetical protein
MNSLEWQKRLAKVLLIWSWRLPYTWGFGKASINMAKAIGFIIGEYTIPSDFPIIYIMDSRTLKEILKTLMNSHTERK